MKVHLWKAYNYRKISVDVRKEFKEKIKFLIKNKIYEIANKINLTPARLYDYFIYKNSPIPLNILISLCNLFRISLIEMEKSIMMYKHMYVPNKNSIQKPNLPLEITPYFTSIISNLYFDGSVPEDGKGTYYNQKDEQIMDDFIKKVKFVFGNVQYSVRKDHRGVLKCRLPRIIGEICKSVYKVNSFGTFNSKLSKKIFSLSKEHKIAFILTAILDEGSITHDGRIFFGISNKLLCDDVQRLCNEISLKTTKIKKRLNKNHYYFWIASKDRLLEFIGLFNKKYPLISLRYKEKRLRYYFKIKKYPGLRTKKGANERRSRIIDSLKKSNKTVNQLTEELLIPPKSVRRHLSYLKDNKKVLREKISNEFIYSLANPIDQ